MILFLDVALKSNVLGNTNNNNNNIPNEILQVKFGKNKIYADPIATS